MLVRTLSDVHPGALIALFAILQTNLRDIREHV
jgi:hypothetical protein